MILQDNFLSLRGGGAHVFDRLRDTFITPYSIVYNSGTNLFKYYLLYYALKTNNQNTLYCTKAFGAIDLIP
jgi:hypothetical protein